MCLKCPPQSHASPPPMMEEEEAVSPPSYVHLHDVQNSAGKHMEVSSEIPLFYSLNTSKNDGIYYLYILSARRRIKRRFGGSETNRLPHVVGSADWT